MSEATNQNSSRARLEQLEQLIDAVIERRAAGELLTDEQVIAQHSELLPELGERLRDLGRVHDAACWAAGGAAGLELTTEVTAPKETFSQGIPGYRLIREISRGGQGVVYQAVQESTKRKVAVKVLLEGPYASESARNRFQREVDLVAQLKHAHIVTIFDSGTTSSPLQGEGRGEGLLWFAMDYVRGLPLHQYVRENKLTLEQALKLFGQVCEAVQYAHQKGVIHRDLKPSNILVDSDGVPRVLDFGLAKQAGPVETVVSLTGQVVGTLPYMSPEQARGNPDHIDTRTDVYALGVILYELLTGHFPYPVAGMMDEVLRNIRETPPTPPSRAWRADSGVGAHGKRKHRPSQCPIDDEVQTIVLKALAKERERRYQTTGELRRDIGHYLAGEPIEAKRDSGWYVLRKQLRQHRGPVVAGLAVILSLTLGLAGTLWKAAEAQREAARAGNEAAAARLAEAEQRRLAESEAAARKTADAKTAETEAALKTIEYNSYVANVGLAAAAMEFRQFDRVRTRLDACATRLRGWEWGWLDSPLDNSQSELKGHTERVFSAVFNPESTRIVTASGDNTARVWDVATGANLAELKGHTRWVHSAAYSPDGTRIVTASYDRTARVWDAATGASLAELKGHTNKVWDAAFSPDGTRIVTASEDKTARAWDAATGARLAELQGHTKLVYSAAFSPDGTRIVTASQDNTARVWDAATGASLAELKGHTEPVSSAAYSPDGTRIVTASYDRTARVWDAATGARLAELKGHNEVLSAAFSPDGTRIVTASQDKTARVWDAATGARLAELQGHILAVYSAGFSPDGTRIVTASMDNTARVWDAATGASLAELKGHRNEVLSAAFSPDGTRIVTASMDNTARVWGTAKDASLVELKGPTRAVTFAAFSPDGTRIVTASDETTARAWDAATGASLVELKGHTQWVTSAAFSPDGTRIVTASYDKTARVWDAGTGVSLAELKGHTKRVYSAAFSPDGTRIVTASADNTARVWDAATGASLVELKGHT